jgi:hypothetical protein
MGRWNHHGMDDDEEEVEYAISVLALLPQEMEALVEHCRREQWIWKQVAHHKKGQAKRKANLIANWLGLRMNKWIDLVAIAEVQYEEEHGMFATKEGD